MFEPRNFNILRDNTRKLLFEFRDNAPFLSDYSFVGGSALALYLCHRNSEDLDFFTFEDAFDRESVVSYCRKFSQFQILNESDNQLDLLVEGVKATFFNAKWKFLTPVTRERLNIATLDSIAAMKVNTLFLRAKYRDYYDLYCLVDKVYELRAMYECAKNIVPGLTYKMFCIALTYIDDIEDDSIEHLSPVRKLTKDQIRSFFERAIHTAKR